METHKSQQNKQVSKAATIVFVFMAALFLYTVVRLSGYFVRQELAGIPTPKNPAQNCVEDPAATPQAQPEDTANVVIAVRTPAPESPTPTPASPAAATPSQTPIVKAPLPSPTPESARSAAPTPLPARFDEAELDLLIVGFEEGGSADLICVLSVRGENSMLFSLPRNTIGFNNTTLGSAKSIAEVREQLSALTGICFEYYASFQQSAIRRCTDAVGGIEIGGALCGGAEAFERLSAAGLDEILRAAQQQDVLLAFAKEVQSLNLLRLWNVKNTLQGNASSNLTGDQGWLLYRRLKKLDLEKMRLALLPVDSEVIGNRRFYRLDQEKLEKFITEVYKNR